MKHLPYEDMEARFDEIGIPRTKMMECIKGNAVFKQLVREFSDGNAVMIWKREQDGASGRMYFVERESLRALFKAVEG